MWVQRRPIVGGQPGTVIAGTSEQAPLRQRRSGSIRIVREVSGVAGAFLCSGPLDYLLPAGSQEFPEPRPGAAGARPHRPPPARQGQPQPRGRSAPPPRTGEEHRVRARPALHRPGYMAGCHEGIRTLVSALEGISDARRTSGGEALQGMPPSGLAALAGAHRVRGDAVEPGAPCHRVSKTCRRSKPIRRARRPDPRRLSRPTRRARYRWMSAKCRSNTAANARDSANDRRISSVSLNAPDRSSLTPACCRQPTSGSIAPAGSTASRSAPHGGRP